MGSSKRIGPDEIHQAITRLASAIRARHSGSPAPVLLGIANGGITLARRLAGEIAQISDLKSQISKPRSKVHAGLIDISFHRDDIDRNPIPKEFAPTHIPVDVNGATVVLVDDVLFTGRTVKAALDELFDHGRPASVELAVLVDRGGRRVPVAPDYCGLTLKAGDGSKVSVRLDPDDPAKDVIRVLPAGQPSAPPFRQR